MARDVLATRELIWRLFLRDIAARYRQTAFGIIWVVALPVVAIGTFVALRASGVVQVMPAQAPYVPWALVGLTSWQVFAGGLATASGSIVSGGTMVTKIGFPKTALVFASLGATIVETIVRIGLIGIALWWFGGRPTPTALLFPLALLPMFLLTAGVGMVLALLTALYRDVAHGVTLGTTFLLLATPVLYPQPTQGPLGVLARLNPLVALVDGPRDLFFSGRLLHPSQFWIATTAAFFGFLICWRLFHLLEARVVERL